MLATKATIPVMAPATPVMVATVGATVLAVQVDMQGRLMGKRFQAEYFLDSASKETHSCNYLLATDMEMHTVEGYKATSWAAGYGDYIMKPSLTGD